MKKSVSAHHPRIAAGFCLLVAAIFALGCKTALDPAVDARSRPFDEQTSGRQLVAAAVAQAKAEDRKVILLFGANWCPYCVQLHALLENDPAVSALVERSFVVVPIDVGTSARNRNVRLIDRYQANVFTDGTPSVVVIDAGGNRLAPTADNPWSARQRIEPGRVLKFLENAGG